MSPSNEPRPALACLQPPTRGPWLTINSEHIAELNSARPKQPFFFLKPSTSILLPGEGPVIRPRGVDLHYEVELALIIGKTFKDLEETDVQGAFDAIESMCCVPCQRTGPIYLRPRRPAR